jgi:hypothetical protein
MHRGRRGFQISKIDIADALRASALLLLILMTIAFFTGCETNKQQADSNSIMQKAPSSGQQVHGEAGVMYAASASRH